MQSDAIVPTVKDRIVQQAVRLVIEPIFEHEFAEASYGFRPGRGCHDALREVDRLVKAGYVAAGMGATDEGVHLYRPMVSTYSEQ